MILYQLVTGYISGSIGDLENIKFKSQLNSLKRNIFGFKVFNLLENDYEPVNVTPKENRGIYSVPLE